MPALQMIPTNKIAAGDNPRGAIDEKSDGFKELCGSIEARGVLQSILVGPANGNGKHTVIAGHRRFAAAQKVKLAEIPAMVVDASGAELTLALIENIQREDLSPVAEARAIRQLREKLGLSQVEAASTLSKSERWARERERLCDLPGRVQEAFDARAIPLEATGDIAKISEKAPKAAEALAARAIRDGSSDDEEKPGRNLADRRDLAVAIEEAIEDEKGETSAAHFLFEVDWSFTLDELERANVPEEFLKFLREGFDELQKLDRWAKPQWTDEEIDQARAYGCLLELECPNRYDPDSTVTRTYITDSTWLGEHALGLLNAARAEVKKRTARTSSTPDAKPEKGSDAEKKAKEKKRQEREKELDHREGVRALNLELGQRTEKAMRGLTLSLAEEQLLALQIVGADAADFGARGLIYCYHDYQEEEKLKNGRTKVTYAGGGAAGEDLKKAILGAKKGEPLAIALRALLLAANANQDCVAQSSRSWWQVPGAGAHDEVAKLLSQIADDREVLPDAIRKERAEKLRKRVEKADLALLLAVKSSRAKEGAKHDQLLAESRMITLAVIDDAVDRKWLKAHESGDLSYTITAAGTKRLEKLKAAEQERSAAK